MVVTFNPQLKIASSVAFKQGEAVKAAPSTLPVAVPATPEEKKPKVANFASKVAYAWINFAETTKGIIKGTLAAAVVGTTIAGADAVVSGIKKKAYKDIFKNPTKAMGKVGKLVAPVVAATVLAGHMISARLKANKRTANVDHQLYTNHRADKK